MNNLVSLLSNEELAVQKHLLKLIVETTNLDDLGHMTTAYGTFCHSSRQLSEGLVMRLNAQSKLPQ